jgi:hypothetical protein
VLVVRGVAELFSIWRGVFSLVILRIEHSYGLEGFDFSEMPQLSMIHDSGHHGRRVQF